MQHCLLGRDVLQINLSHHKTKGIVTRCDERLVSNRGFMQLELGDEGHLEHMTEKRINNEAVEKFRPIFCCIFAHFLINWPEEEFILIMLNEAWNEPLPLLTLNKKISRQSTRLRRVY